MDNNYVKYETEIDLKHFICALLLHWRSLIVSIVVGIIVGSGIFFIKTYSIKKEEGSFNQNLLQTQTTNVEMALYLRDEFFENTKDKSNNDNLYKPAIYAYVYNSILNKFTKEEKALFDYIVSTHSKDNINIKMSMELYNKDNKKMSKKALIKQIIIACFIFIFVWVVIWSILYLTDGNIKTVSEIEDRYNIYCYGIKRNIEKKKSIDKLFMKWFYYFQELNGSWEYAINEIVLYGKDSNIIVCGDKDSVLEMQQFNASSNSTKNIKLEFGYSCLDTNTLKNVIQSSGIVIIVKLCKTSSRLLEREILMAKRHGVTVKAILCT